MIVALRAVHRDTRQRVVESRSFLKLKREEQDSEARLRQQLQDKGLNDERRQALVKEYYAEIDRRAKKLAQYISDSEVHPNLKAANH